MFKHYLLTRFNIKNHSLAEYARLQRGTIVQTEEWLNKRFELFEKFCFPSVNQQTTKNFTWLVFFDKNTPDKYKLQIKNYSKICPMFHAIFVETGVSEVEIAVNYIKSNTDAQTIITTNLDNDDMIHKDYIKNIQDTYSPLYQNTFLLYRYGYQYNVSKKTLFKFADDYNHFGTRIEQQDTFYTIWVKNDRHDLVSHYGDIKLISPPAVSNKNYPGMWIEVVHDCNVVNNSGKGKPLSTSHSNFSPNLKINHFNQIRYQLCHSISKLFRINQ